MVEFVELEHGLWIGVSSDLVYIVSEKLGEVPAVATENGVYRLDECVMEFREENARFEFTKWFEPGPLSNFSIFPSVEELVAAIEPLVRDVVRNRRVVVSFSGGKDSAATLLAMKNLCERIGCEVIAAYIHMPYIEPRSFIDEARRIAKVVGVELVEDEPPRKLVRKYMLVEGLPYRRNRWCTYLKARKLREIARSMNAELMAVGDRMWENVKRFRRLAPMIRNGRIHRKRVLYPVAMLPLSDIITIVSDHGAIHGAYLSGLMRVSCILCPYKSVVEIASYDIDMELEDPGLIESVLMREWRLWYQRVGIDFDTFVKEALWRFVPRVAKMMYIVKQRALRNGELVFKRDELRRFVANAWRTKRRYTRIGLHDVLSLELQFDTSKPYVNVLELLGCPNEGR